MAGLAGRIARRGFWLADHRAGWRRNGAGSDRDRLGRSHAACHQLLPSRPEGRGRYDRLPSQAMTDLFARSHSE